uniref:ADF-H domain-containing protein n=1 Tax=Lotharella globosa TaxID=91324 RepID=A0A7S3Z9Y8_9EUKA|mmetsp:Transcript_15940/g.32376  ORF Transcript_15940/g.32376 Transcript_15940/m.32376 type:complete len:148 (-) Transcript_15940:818-1261(-)|eukprot:CAMPEP_0167786910 /NCGR_PEP_ID=MMETSP0111_2-20121227/9095_1 /TAXON_ID=91324 /ORGANISM="Lotharella globosa, Strain CCCM811" /LENGTH=147 /DNA_ID=CAMNT_0007678425 /DNA_START=80 /DNA_END=523 /DNA_ORIENTATION=-
MASGIKVDKGAFKTYDEDMKKKHNYKFLLFQLNKKMDKVVIVDQEKGDKKLNPSYDDFIKALCVEGQPRWGVLDYEAKKKDGSILNKLVMFSWCQDTAALRKKMLHGSTNNTVKSKLGIETCFHASSPADIEETVVMEKYGLETKTN